MTTTQEFVFDYPLFKKAKLSESNILNDFCRHMRIDGYNPHSKADSTFELATILNSSYLSESSIDLLRFVCRRYNDNMYVLIHYDQRLDFIEKVGQFPSIADIHIAKVKKYNKVLGEPFIKDFTRAIGLAANGIGTGSYVYLRRLFEHLIDEIASEAIKRGEIDKKTFESGHMSDKLELVSNYLPDAIKDNKSLYGVLSVGIHSLTEEDCLAYFPVVRSVIELILDDLEYARQKEEKRKKAIDQLGHIAGELRKNTSSSE